MSRGLRPPASRYPLFERNFILKARSRFHEWEGVGPLSIKTFSGGRAFYRAGRGYYGVEGGRYLLLNEHETYSVSIDADEPVSSFCVFFKRGFAERVLKELSTRPDRLLEDPGAGQTASVEFVQRTYVPSPELASALGAIRRLDLDGEADGMRAEAHFHELMRILLTDQAKVRREAARIPALRASTREELMKRAAVAYEYVEACYDRQVTLEGLARLACLSVNHLLTAYRAMYGTTPYRHLVDRRIDQAKRWLRHTDRTVTDIALSLGFEEVSSFNKRFNQRVGCSPTAYRRFCENGQAEACGGPVQSETGTPFMDEGAIGR
ncbi:helix-turn-helix transcriptional regulator [Paenibacillus thermoaerophilus]|uniref:Helix-turn-helix transcriptional regulator n=1 Tax=Paenibacillus thermoaerophilus TaxID=1215385 RepID=A0ABW2V5E6_9BACL|nr:AraC family transcriptional regulator [Paenibacillus thermoaerophilus]TMV18648.1 AraC family transcriptional regulator [Paenibacillus thermoaerophilus]